MFYHVRVNLKSAKKCENATDISKEKLISRFIEPYELGESFLINGRTVTVNDLERIQIYASERTIESFIPAIRAEQQNSSFVMIGGPSYSHTAMNRADKVTDDFISGPPGYKSNLKKLGKDNELNKSGGKKVFIVHGHDETAQSKAARFVEKLGLEAIILHEKASSGRTIIEKIEHYPDVGFAIILYTPDDIGNVKSKAEDLNLRARQNVIFEHGYLMGKLGREKVAALVDGQMELPNDISGVVYIGLDESSAWHLHLAKEMKQAGYNIDLNKLI